MANTNEIREMSDAPTIILLIILLVTVIIISEFNIRSDK